MRYTAETRRIKLGKMIFFEVVDPDGDFLVHGLRIGINYIEVDQDGHAYLNRWHISRFKQIDRPASGFKVWK
jgi:hypothetical protein